MSISFNGFGEKAATFKAAEGLAAGVPVKVSANDTAAPCAAGDDFCGVAMNVSGGYAAVQLSGFAVLPYTGATAPAVGYSELAADGSGGVKVLAGGRSLLVVNVDTTAKTAGIVL